MRRKHRTMTRAEESSRFAAQALEEGRGFHRRHSELFLLIVAAIPVLLLYSMYVLTSGNELGLENLGVPLGLFGPSAWRTSPSEGSPPRPTLPSCPSSFFCRASA